MKKILFVVCTHGDELAPLQLFLQYPYGKNTKVEWKVVIGNPEAITLNKRFTETDLNRSFNSKQIKNYEEHRAERLKKIFPEFDVLYDVHTTQRIKNPKLPDCIFVNSIDQKVIDECRYLQSTHIIWDSDEEYSKQYLTAHHPIGITLEYQKTPSYKKDVERIIRDFKNIVHQKEVGIKKNIYQADRPVTQREAQTYRFKFEDFVPLSSKEKELLALYKNSTYVPVFVNPLEIDQNYYCFLNKRIK